MGVSDGMKSFENKTCAVLGLGKSNRPLVELLLRFGARVTVRDRQSESSLGEIVAQLRARGVDVQLGENYLDGLCEDFIFRSPGIRPDLPEILHAVESGSVLTSEMELFLELTPACVLGITGSDGKTTTTTLTGLFLARECEKRGHGRVFVGGNIGAPLLPMAEEMTASDFCVVELSSFQLQTMRRALAQAALTNITPNHLNWHTDMEEYIAAKMRIYRGEENRLLVTNAECEITRALAASHMGRVTYFSSSRSTYEDFDFLKSDDRAIYLQNGKIMLWDGTTEREMLDASQILLRGVHNLENYMTAIGLTDGLVLPETLCEVAKRFTGVRHRLEYVCTVDGVAYYNSSIDSSPTRTAAALSAMEKKPIVIVGGRDKNFDFLPLAKTLYARAKAVVLTGEAAPKIRAALNVYCTEHARMLTVYENSDFEEAVKLARRIAEVGDVVLLSPSCTSFDAFRNFEERGDCFCAIVKGFETEKGE